MEHFRSVRDQMLSILIDRGHSPYRIFADVGMSMVKASLGRRKQRLDQLRFSKFGEKAQRVTTHELVRMLEVVPDTITILR